MNNVIQVDHLIKQYKKSQKAAVDDISFNVREGEFFAFLGPNGAGKTTTISILTTLLSKTNGTVSIAGYDLDKEAKKIRYNTGIIFQNPSLDLELTAEENIRLHVSIYGTYRFRPFYGMMPKAYKQRIEELAEIVGLQESLFKNLKTFSGGMKRKLEIIRSLMHNPKILFLDEPTQGLDAASRHSLWEYLNRVRTEENITIFLTTHYLEEAEGADRICIINNGKIAMSGTPGQLKERLIQKYMYVDATDQNTLKTELCRLGAAFMETGQGLKVAYKDKTPQKLLSGLDIPLTKLEIHQPSIEEAYLDLIKEGSVLS
ncbi:ATP-binding cassette domain-containing protein [Alkaliphilus serpentinus]|uniref:ABC transporter ATP-binding protein n=1 Tax=Alkaliphilus serpentinus TaxID=1482731 RepID=A0A833HLN1_9FIRM|nr:ABC transporter ATP-binding protein [Alkaliphilus serpentinus]KAB3526256.1 ABC transporter ATP-binding protein [Alkaliphilus serpentinus]